MPSYNECIFSVNIINNYVESGHVGSINELGQHPENISTSIKLQLLNMRRSLSAATGQAREMQLA